MQTASPDSDGSHKRGSTAATRHSYHAHAHPSFTRGGALTHIQLCVALLGVVIPLSVFASTYTATSATVAISTPTPTNDATDSKLLAAHITADPIAARGGGDIIVSEGALVPGGAVGEDVLHQNHAAGEISLYVVREGDTLSQIAEMFEVNSNTI